MDEFDKRRYKTISKLTTGHLMVLAKEKIAIFLNDRYSV